MPPAIKASTSRPTTFNLGIYFPFASKCWQQWLELLKGYKYAGEQQDCCAFTGGTDTIHLPALHCIAAQRAVTVLLGPHTYSSLTADLENWHSRKGSAEPTPWLDCLYSHRQALETHQGDRYTQTLYKNTKHNGESFPPLAGKGYSLIVAIRITAILGQIPHLTFWDCCYTCIVKLWAKITFGYGKRCTWFKEYLATYLCIEPVNPKYSKIL